MGQPKIWLKMEKIGPRGACVQNLSVYAAGSSFTFEGHFLSEFYERKNMEVNAFPRTQYISQTSMFHHDYKLLD